MNEVKIYLVDDAESACDSLSHRKAFLHVSKGSVNFKRKGDILTFIHGVMLITIGIALFFDL